MVYNRKDYFFHKAKEQNFAARSVFKLEEIDQKFHILKTGDKVIDLGAAPGSWSQFTSRKIGQKGRLLGIDLQPVKLTLPNAVFLTADMRELDLPETLKTQGFEPPFDVVLSDMAPRTTGIRLTDQVRSAELCDLALSVAERYLKNGGHFVCKIFHSGEFEVFRARLRERFRKVEILRPKSTRKESKEIFFIGTGFRGTSKQT